MALQRINRLPDRQEATFIRVDTPKTFDVIIREQARGVARIHETVTVVVNLTRQEMRKQADSLDPTPILGQPAVGTHWILSSWSSCQNFDTPSGNLEPGTYCETGERATYGNQVDWFDGDLPESEKAADVVVQRGAGDTVERITKRSRSL